MVVYSAIDGSPPGVNLNCHPWCTVPDHRPPPARWCDALGVGVRWRSGIDVKELGDDITRATRERTLSPMQPILIADLAAGRWLHTRSMPACSIVSLSPGFRLQWCVVCGVSRKDSKAVVSRIPQPVHPCGYRGSHVGVIVAGACRSRSATEQIGEQGWQVKVKWFGRLNLHIVITMHVPTTPPDAVWEARDPKTWVDGEEAFVVPRLVPQRSGDTEENLEP